jgi:DNA-binding CsgD family transcriptional regulator
VTVKTTEDKGQTAGRAASGLFGRERELSVLTALVDRSIGGHGGALVVTGEAGVGKSALLAEVAGRAEARGTQVLTVAGVPSEAHWAFAGLHQLLRPVLHRVHGLAPRQRAALLGGFGRSGETRPELFLVALAALEMIGDSHDCRPVLLVAEDAQWLDQPTCAVLAFVARRLAAQPVAMLIASRDGYGGWWDSGELPVLRLERLAQRTAELLLDARAHGLDGPTRRRLLDVAVGNPLALVDLPGVLRSEQVGDEPPGLLELPLTGRLERAFAGQQAHLPTVTRVVLLVAAANDGDQLAETLSASAIVCGADVPIDAVTAAVAARLLEIAGDRVRFRHPVMRSAIYQAAGPVRRRAAHAALSEVLRDRPERRIWHQAAAALGPHEQLASALERTAEQAESRGAMAVAVRAQQRAAELSEHPRRQGTRLLRAAELAFDLGRSAAGRRLMGSAEALDLGRADRDRLSWLREIYRSTDRPLAVRDGSVAVIAGRVRFDDRPDLAVKLLHSLAQRCWWGNADDRTRAAVLAAAARMPPAGYEPARLAILACADPVGQSRRVLDRIATMTPDAGQDPTAMHLVGIAASAVWAFDVALAFLDIGVDGLRAQGRLRPLAQALGAQAWALVHLARQSQAVSVGEEAWLLARETGQPRWAAIARLAQATIAAERGDLPGTESMIRDAELTLRAGGTAPLPALTQFVRGRGAVAHHRYAEGLDHHARTLDPLDPAYHPYIGAWGLSDLVEAAAHTDRTASALCHLADLETLAAATAGSLLRATAGFARPMVAADADAERLYRHALGHDLANWPSYRGRMLLLYGSWLRRRRRVAESRGALRAARAGFDALALPGLAELARGELRASGETGDHRDPRPWGELTPQELRIARLAATGLSNREIGERLCLSHRTVGYHLHRIFPKLGITSRSQLHAAVTGPQE